jgi:hypothetical protein
VESDLKRDVKDIILRPRSEDARVAYAEGYEAGIRAARNALEKLGTTAGFVTMLQGHYEDSGKTFKGAPLAWDKEKPPESEDPRG